MGSLLFRSEILTRVGVLLVLFSLGSTMSDMDPDREPLVDAAEHASAAARREAGAAKAANRKIRPRKVGMRVCVCVCVCVCVRWRAVRLLPSHCSSCPFFVP